MFTKILKRRWQMVSKASCHYCPATFENFKELAKHIIASKKVGLHSNRKSQAWAKKFLMNKDFLDRKVSMNQGGGRIALTEEQKQNKEDIKRELSGQTKYVKTKCPKCKTLGFDFVEVEHLIEPFIWTENERILKNCEVCRK